MEYEELTANELEKPKFLAGFGANPVQISKMHEYNPDGTITESLFCPRCHSKMIYMGKVHHFWRCVSSGCIVRRRGYVRYTELWPAEESPLEREKREKAAREEFEGRRFVNERGGELLPTGFVPGGKKGGSKKAGKKRKKRLKMEKFYPVLDGAGK